MTSLNRLTPSRTTINQLLKVARGDIKADIVIKDVNIIDLVNGEIITSSIALYQGWIAGIADDYQGHIEINGKDRWAVPGFIDSHTHLESSMMHPFEFTKATLPKGTTTAICDPHEIANVLGKPGIDWLLRCAEQLPQTLLFQVPSCIPSLANFETNGSSFSLDEMIALKQHPHIFGLGEMMNVPGILNGDNDAFDKLDAFSDRPRDGHAPSLQGKDLNAYRCAGIQNCHESITSQEAREKLRIGMAVMLREGSVAKNLDTMAEIVTEFNSHQCLLCTDDRNPYEISKEGHINYLVWRLINRHNMPLHTAYRLASYAPAQHYKLDRLGLIAPGYRADILLLSNPHEVTIDTVICGGKILDVNELDNCQEKLQASKPPLDNSINFENLTPQHLSYPLVDGIYNVIGIIPNEIITDHLEIFCQDQEFSEPGINKIAVIERYGQNTPPAIGFVKGFTLIHGAIAASVAHDCHNVIVVGANDSDMAQAANHLKTIGGGFTVVKDGQVLADLPLAIAGLISTESAETITTAITHLKHACQSLGCSLHEPFLQMAFLALPVIPKLKITDRGLIDTQSLTFLSALKDKPHS